MESNEPSNFEHSTFHNPTYTTRIVLPSSSPIRDRFTSIRNISDTDIIPEIPPRNRFMTTSKSPENVPFSPITEIFRPSIMISTSPESIT